MTWLNVEDYEDIFTELEADVEDSREEKIEKLRDKSVSKCKRKTVKSGPILECEIYPIWDAAKCKRRKVDKSFVNVSKEAQDKRNERMRMKKVNRQIDTNFTEKDIWLTLTYTDDKLPEDLGQAKKDMRNYVRRLQRKVKANGWDELKYIYVTEYIGEDGESIRVHHHMICNFPDRNLAESLWNGGGRTQSKRLQPDDLGLEGLARYITKQKQPPKKSPTREHKKSYTVSRNLDAPKVTVANSKVTRRKAERIAMQEVDAKETFEKMYPGYQFQKLEVRYNPYVAGVYLYAKMKKIPEEQSRFSRRGGD